MQLPGRLSRTTLGDLLGRLHRAGASGALEIAPLAGRKHRLLIQRGLVAGLALDMSPPPARLGELLIRGSLAPSKAIERALEAQRANWAHAPLGELLVRASVLSAELRDSALRKQARARIDALFASIDGQEAEVRFHVGIAATAIPKFVAPLIAHEFLAGRKRHRALRAKNDPVAAWTTPTPPPISGVYPVDKLRAMRLLGVDAGADEAAIRRAFRAAAARVHPDRHTDAEPAERQRLHVELAALTAAYHLLSA